MASRIYFDSCIAIYRVEQIEPWSARIEQRLLALPGDARLCLSDLTWMECRVGPLRAGDPALLTRYDDFFARPEATSLSMTRAVFARASELRAAHRIKTPDALHLAAALVGGCTDFWTNDDRLANVATGHLRVFALDENP